MSDKVFSKDEWNAELEIIATGIECIDDQSKRTTPVLDKAISIITANYAEFIREHKKP